MKHASSSLLLLAPLAVASAVCGAEVQLRGYTFRLADGFELEVAAAPPLVDRPIVCDFDEDGRLYVADSGGSNDKVEKQLQDRPHRIVRLEDTDRDGRFDRSVVFADKMMFPEGILWHDGAVYCGAPPSIWRLRDLDGDGVADERHEWLASGVLTGCANDIHGPYLGRDGRIYWTKGGFGKQNLQRPGKPPYTDSAAHIYRARADGTELESFMAGGMDNPVEVVFGASGDVFFTTTFFVHPAAGQRDALVHALYGGVYPKPHGVLDGIPRTGELLPCLVHLGPAVPSGLALYESDALGPEYSGDLFSSQFNYRKIARHRLTPAGATFTSQDEDILASDHPDFHPTDVLEDADGSLLVLDTGGWYRLCCPSSQIARPEVLGTIYRLRRKGMRRLADPRGLELRWSELEAAGLAALLGDERPAVRRRAMAVLARSGAPAVTAAGRAAHAGRTAQARRDAVWTLTRIEDAKARDAVRAALADADETVRAAALSSVALHRDALAVTGVLELLASGSAAQRRAAATALGRLGIAAAIPALLDAAPGPADRMLEHAFIHALIELGDAKLTRAGIDSPAAATRRAALIALDQLPQGGLAADDVAPHLAAADPVLRETAEWIVEHRSGWGHELAGFFRDQLARRDLPPAEAEKLRGQLARLAREGAIQELLAAAAADGSLPAAARALAVRAMGASALKEAPAGWLAPLAKCLEADDAALLDAAVQAARTLPAPKDQASALAPGLARVAGDAQRNALLRLQALSALPPGNGSPAPELFTLTRGALAADRPLEERAAAALVCARATLSEPQLVALTADLREAGPIEFPQLLQAFTRSASEAVGRALVAALGEARGLTSLRPDSLRALLEKYPEPVKRAGEDLGTRIAADLASRSEKLEELARGLVQGDATRGREVYHGARAACSTCHAIAYLGGRIGPDLSKIGGVRTERDLLESIVFPSASFVRSYEPVEVVTRDGQVHAGTLEQESGGTVKIVKNATESVRLGLDEVAEMRPGSVSIMPQGLDQQLTPGELADLVAFLRTLK